MKKLINSLTEITFPQKFIEKQQQKENNITININLLTSDDLVTLRDMLYAVNHTSVDVNYNKYIKEINERILWLAH